ncbi:MAG: hypothetical protein INR71_02615 [Terriglobus roseus]|nr:hypothetical protein [Terriglobus roseus]
MSSKSSDSVSEFLTMSTPFIVTRFEKDMELGGAVKDDVAVSDNVVVMGVLEGNHAAVVSHMAS